MRIIESDVFDIAKRVKEIDQSYLIVFNERLNRFELFDGREKKFILVIPFDSLDERTVVHVRKTRIERLDKLIEEIEENNQKIEKAALRDAQNGLKEQLESSADRVFYEERYS